MKKLRFTMPVAVHLLLIRNNEILMLRRFNTGYEDGNEDLKSAMIREANEEAGIKISKNNLQFASVMHRKSDDERIDFFFVTDSWDGEVTNMEPEKCDDLSWFKIDSLPSNTISYIKRAIENYKSEIPFDDLGV